MDKAKPYFIAGAAFIAYGAYKCIEQYVLNDEDYANIKRACDDMSDRYSEYEGETIDIEP
jgi:hypothetical protein